MSFLLVFQSSAWANDFITACQDLAQAEVVFIGRAKPPLTRRISGEAEIARAREKWERLNAQLEESIALRPVDSPPTPHQLELAQQLTDASDEWSRLMGAWPPAQEVQVIPFDVERPFRGVTTSEISLSHDDPDVAVVGQAYLVFGRTPFPVADIVSTHKRPQPVESAAEALRFLNLALSGDHGAAIYGSLAIDANGKNLPLPGISIRLEIAKRLFHAMTTPDGSFMFTGAPAGTAEITPLVSDTLTIGGGRSITREVPGGGCLSVPIAARPNGCLRGHVSHDDGKPLSNSEVQIQHEGTTTGYSEARTNERGEFEFAGLRPGVYVLGVNLYATPTAGAPYRATYFPGTTNREEATRIVIGEGTEQSGLDWTLTGRLETGEMKS